MFVCTFLWVKLVSVQRLRLASELHSIMIKFVLMVNKQGQTRLAKYYDFKPVAERATLEGELIRRCLSRTESQCSFLEYRQYKIVYRRYASLYFIVGVDDEDVVRNEYYHDLHFPLRRGV